MPYNFATGSFHTKKLCSGLSSSKVQFFMEIGCFAFLRPPLGDLGATYDDHLWLIGNRVVDFLLVLPGNWTIFARCYGWGATGEYRLKIGDFAPTGTGWLKILGRRGRPHQPFFFLHNYAKWFYVWYTNVDRSFFHFVTNHALDRQTDGRTEFSSLDRVCIACSAVKKKTCLQLTTLRNTAVYGYHHGISVTVYYRRIFLDTAHLYHRHEAVRCYSPRNQWNHQFAHELNKSEP